MKNYLIISLLFLSLGFSQKEYNSNDIIEMDNGLWTEKFSDEPITGKVYGGFGEVKPYKKVYMGNLLNGKKEGRWKSYFHSNGKKEFDYNYKDGLEDGVITYWFENGKKRVEINFKKVEEGTYKDGKLDGLRTYWDENGKKYSERNYKDGELQLLLTDWDENGKKESEINYKDGELDGLWTEWFENGQKKKEVNYKEGKLISYKYWNEDGSVFQSIK